MLIFPYCPSSPAAPPSASEVKMLTAQCREALRDVGGIPIFFDLSSGDRMISQTESACLSALGSGGQALRPLFHWMETRIPRLYAGQPIGIIHGYLNVSNLITEGGDLRYILGWQRPMPAPLRQLQPKFSKYPQMLTMHRNKNCVWRAMNPRMGTGGSLRRSVIYCGTPGRIRMSSP